MNVTPIFNIPPKQWTPEQQRKWEETLEQLGYRGLGEPK